MIRRNNYFYNWKMENPTQPTHGVESSTLASKYIPLYAINQDYKQRYAIIYYKPNREGVYSTQRIYKDMVKSFRGLYDHIQFSLIVNGEEELLYIGKGFIIDGKGNFLFLYVADSQDIENIEKDRMFMSYEIFQDKYKKVYKEIYSNFIMKALMEDVPLEIISSDKIQSTVYTPILKRFNEYETVEEFNEFLDKGIEEEFLSGINTLSTLAFDDYTEEVLIQMAIQEKFGVPSHKSIVQKLKALLKSIPKDNETTLIDHVKYMFEYYVTESKYQLMVEDIAKEEERPLDVEDISF